MAKAQTATVAVNVMEVTMTTSAKVQAFMLKRQRTILTTTRIIRSLRKTIMNNVLL